MFVAIVLLASIVARTSAQYDGIDVDCVLPLQPYQACLPALSKNCPPGKTLFDVLDPVELCATPAPIGATTCGAGLTSTFKALDDDGCCTLNSFHPVLAASGQNGNCSTSEPLSYEGLSHTVSYFCENQPYNGNDFYCLKDGQTYIQQIHPILVLTMYLMAQSDIIGAVTVFNTVVDCNKLQATQCCYPSIRAFIAGCGGEEAQMMIPMLNMFISSIPQACANFQAVAVDFSSICSDLAPITNCFASTDENCLMDDDDDDDDSSKDDGSSNRIIELLRGVSKRAAVAIIAGIVVLVVVCCCVFRCRRKRRRTSPSPSAPELPREPRQPPPQSFWHRRELRAGPVESEIEIFEGYNSPVVAKII